MGRCRRALPDPRDAADAQHPGGAAGLAAPTAFFNAAFRFHEPWQHTFPPDSVFTDPAWWRDREQGNALARGDLSPFHADGRLRQARPAGHGRHGAASPAASRGTARWTASWRATSRPSRGPTTRRACGNATDCQGELRGRLQPYAVYVPAKPAPTAGYGLTLLLHSLGANYNQFSDSRNQSQLGDRGKGSIVITPEGRGPDGWYYGHAGADTFEAWADVAAPLPPRPRLDVDLRLLDGRLRHLQVRYPVPRPVRPANPVVGPAGPRRLGAAVAAPAGRRGEQHQPDARRRSATSRS